MFELPVPDLRGLGLVVLRFTLKALNLNPILPNSAGFLSGGFGLSNFAAERSSEACKEKGKPTFQYEGIPVNQYMGLGFIESRG